MASKILQDIVGGMNHRLARRWPGAPTLQPRFAKAIISPKAPEAGTLALPFNRRLPVSKDLAKAGLQRVSYFPELRKNKGIAPAFVDLLAE